MQSSRFLLAAALLGLGPAQAATLDVVPGESIQDAIDRAFPGDTVRVAPGDYAETLVMDRAITLDAVGVTLDGGGADAVIEFDADGDEDDRGEAMPVLLGITITNEGVGDGITADIPFIARGITIRNTADGIDYEDDSGGIVTDSLFELNTDDGIDLDGAVAVAFERVTICRNGEDGIEARMQDREIDAVLDIVILDSLICENGTDDPSDPEAGDGIQIIDYDRDTAQRHFRIERTIIRDNAGAGIGAVADESSVQAFEPVALAEPVDVLNSVISGNGAAIVGGLDMVIANNRFENNARGLIGVGGASVVTHNAYTGNGPDEDSVPDVSPLFDAAIVQFADAGVAAIETPGRTVLVPGFGGTAPDIGIDEVTGEPGSPIVPPAGPTPELPTEPPEAPPEGPALLGEEVMIETFVVTQDGDQRSSGVDTGDGELRIAGSRKSAMLLFEGVNLPFDAVIDSAGLRLHADEDDAVTTPIRITSDAAADAAAIGTGRYAIDELPRGATAARWNAPPAVKRRWYTAPVAAVVQDIVSRADWVPGNALALVLSTDESGRRAYDSIEGGFPAELVVTYRLRAP